MQAYVYSCLNIKLELCKLVKTFTNKINDARSKLLFSICLGAETGILSALIYRIPPFSEILIFHQIVPTYETYTSMYTNNPGV